VRLLRVESQQVKRIASATTAMSRNFYILAATLVLFALISGGMSLVPSSFQPGLPANASLWRTVALFLLLFGLVAALVGVMSHLFEQVDRRSEEARQAARRKRRERHEE
jgi:fatty acid desaturase